MQRERERNFAKGNALVEYALPAGIFVIGVAIITTTMNINGLLGQYFAMGNGDAASSISGGRYSAKALGLVASGAQGNGSGNFNLSGGSGGFVPGIALTGSGAGGFGGITSSGASNADSTGGQGQDEVLARLQGAKSPMDVYNAIKDSPMSDKFKGLVQAMAQQQMSMSMTTDTKATATGNAGKTDSQINSSIDTNSSSSSKLADLSTGLNSTTLSMLMYAANPASANDIGRYGGDAAVALAKAFSDNSLTTADKAMFSTSEASLAKYADVLKANGIDTASIVNGTANVTQMAQAQILMSLGVTDPSKAKDLIAAMSQNPPPSLAALQALANGKSASEVAAINALADGTCAAALVCSEERDKLLDAAKAELLTAQTAISTANQAAVDAAAKEAAAAATPPAN